MGCGEPKTGWTLFVISGIYKTQTKNNEHAEEDY